MSDVQDLVIPLIGGTSRVNSPLGMKDRDASVCDEGFAGVRDIYHPSLFTNEKLHSVLGFKVGDLLAEGGLCDMQSKRGLGEVQLFGQDNDRVQVPNFDIGEHCSIPVLEFGNTGNCVLLFM